MAGQNLFEQEKSECNQVEAEKNELFLAEDTQNYQNRLQKRESSLKQELLPTKNEDNEENDDEIENIKLNKFDELDTLDDFSDENESNDNADQEDNDDHEGTKNINLAFWGKVNFSFRESILTMRPCGI